MKYDMFSGDRPNPEDVAFYVNEFNMRLKIILKRFVDRVRYWLALMLNAECESMS